MSQDFYLDVTTGDIALEDGTTIKLCPTESELTRQRCLINLGMFKGEWFANVNYGVPFFSRIFRKGDTSVSDSIFKKTIINTEGVVSLQSYNSELSPDRKLTITFSFKAVDGVIVNSRETF